MIRTGASHRRRAAVAASAAALLGIIGGGVYIVGASARQSVAAADLAETVAVHADMSPIRWHRSSPEPVLLADGDAQVGWDDGDDGLSIRITEFSSPYAATFAFMLGDPTAHAAEDFESSPRSVDFDLGAGVDQQEAWCVVDTEAGCFYWMYRARVGQYLLLAARFAPSRAMAQAEFAGYVDDFVRAMHAALPRR